MDSRSTVLKILSVSVVIINALNSPAVMAKPVLEEVMVTAQKRSESVQDIPIAVTALSEGSLSAAKIDTSSQVAALVPNMQVSMPFGETMPVYTIRGITMSEYSLNQAGPIAMYTDEVYRGVAALQAFPLYDLDRVEVLRGPQGTLYGKNVTGGAVNFYSRRPDLSEANGYLTLGAGNYGRLEAKAAFSAPLVENKLAIRGALYYQDVDGYVENLTRGEDASSVEDKSARVSVLYTPNDNLEFLLRAQHLSGDGTGPGTLQTNVGEFGIGFTGETREGLGFHETRSDLVGHNDLDNTLVSLTVNWAMSNSLTMTSISAYQDGSWDVLEDADGIAQSISHNRYLADVDQVSQEIRVSYDNGGTISFIAGAYLSAENVDGRYRYNFLHAFAGDNAPANGINDCQDDFFTGCTVQSTYEQTKESYAAFIQTDFKVTDKINVLAGIRYTREDAELDKYRADNFFLDPASGQELFDYNGIPADGNNFLPTLKDEVDRWGGNIGLEYFVSEDTMLYASWSSAFRGGSYQVQGFYDPSEINFVNPERLEAIELGMKGTFLDQRLRLNAAVFSYDYKDQQYLNTDPNTFLYSLVNAPKSSILGAELEGTWLASEDLTINFGLGYLDTEYDELTLNGVNHTGNELINAPKWNVNSAVNWEILQRDFGTVSLNVNGTYSADQFFDAPNTQRTSQKAYAVLNARLSFLSGSERYGVSTWVRNLTDKEYRTYGFDNVAFFGYDYNQRGLPRMFGVEFIAKF